MSWRINKDPTYKKLLSEFVDYRWTIMLQCADRCEELGSDDGNKMALVWRWLAKWKRWPAARGDGKFGWTYKDSMVAKYPHGLPACFTGFSSFLRNNSKYPTESRALTDLVNNLKYDVKHYNIFTQEQEMQKLLGIVV